MFLCTRPLALGSVVVSRSKDANVWIQNFCAMLYIIIINLGGGNAQRCLNPPPAPPELRAHGYCSGVVACGVRARAITEWRLWHDHSLQRKHYHKITLRIQLKRSTTRRHRTPTNSLMCAWPADCPHDTRPQKSGGSKAYKDNRHITDGTSVEITIFLIRKVSDGRLQPNRRRVVVDGRAHIHAVHTRRM